ncbi:hypothetical protein GCM10010435_04920 [Winogradskya consettensis]|uniref:ABC3 transporter permease C-terminal domain-containing protein n=1 Tax=Winogradskya consettensis TaxID=113560 RepID=A0A919SYQ5_9ACTN|nr:FtsX-like permease family protein [Actinoplanes consettensis]GIM79613.1 hypothetical protein Aco04nite_66450 [Actinoplanes consettensis]
MTTLVLAMLWVRRGQAVALALLSLLAVAASVAAPAYLRAADRAVAAGQVATATPVERGLALSKSEDDRNDPQAAEGNGLGFTTLGPVLASLPGFTGVYASEYPAVGIEPDPANRTRFVFRQDVCAHLSLVSGRCLVGEGDAVIGEQTAKRLELAPGDTITLAYAHFSTDPRTPIFLADGAEKRITVAGTYTVPDPDAAYWGAHGYFSADTGDRPGEPLFVGFATLNTMDHGATVKSVDSTAGPGALDVDKLDGLRAALGDLTDLTGKLNTTVDVRTGLPDLLDRIDSGRAAARQIVPVIAVPLIVLSCFVIFLAAGYGAEGRRPELAVVALRGVRWYERWWLTTGENLIAIVAGSVLGCVAGQLLVNLMAATLFPGVGAAAGFASLIYAPLAAVAAVLAALLAQRRQLFAQVAALLRRVPGTGRRPPVLEAAAILLAVVTGVQLAVSGGDPTGAGLFAPALIIFAVALVVARALLPLVARIASRALRNGRVGVALAGLQLARRPGATGLFSLLIAAVAVTVFAFCAVDSGTRDREVAAELGTGAARAVSVQPVTPSQLMTAVHTVDPHGTFAMAVARTPGNAPGEPAGLAVDAPRLGAVANWPGSGPSAADVGALLHPKAPDAVIIRGQDVNISFEISGARATIPLNLTLAVSSITGRGSARISLTQLGNGSNEYAQRVAACAQGCRVDGVQVNSTDATSGVAAHLRITALGSINPVVPAVSAERLGNPAQWRMSSYGKLTADDGALGVDIDAPSGMGTSGAWIQPVDAPDPMPIVSSGRPADVITGLDGRTLAVDRVAEVPAVPRLGLRATLVDLEYADRAATQSGMATDAEVWLSATAPADVLDRLAAQGLVITGDIRATVARDQLDNQGPALALWFYVLAGCLAIVLGAGALVLAAVVDRARRVEDLSALRTQGLDRRSAGRATLWAYPMMVLIAVLAGTGTGLAGYGLTGWALPLAGLEPPPLPLPIWPRAWVIALVALAILVVLGGVATLTSRNLRRSVL